MLRRGVSREENNAKGVRSENLSELRKALAEVPRPHIATHNRDVATIKIGWRRVVGHRSAGWKV